MRPVTITIPSEPEYVSTLRLVTASIAQKMGFDIEAIDDLRVCIAEAVNYAMKTNETITVHFEEQTDRLVIDVEATADEKDQDGLDLRAQIMESLLDAVVIEKNHLELTKIL